MLHIKGLGYKSKYRSYSGSINQSSDGMIGEHSSSKRIK